MEHLRHCKQALLYRKTIYHMRGEVHLLQIRDARLMSRLHSRVVAGAAGGHHVLQALGEQHVVRSGQGSVHLVEQATD